MMLIDENATSFWNFKLEIMNVKSSGVFLNSILDTKP